MVLEKGTPGLSFGKKEKKVRRFLCFPGGNAGQR